MKPSWLLSAAMLLALSAGCSVDNSRTANQICLLDRECAGELVCRSYVDGTLRCQQPPGAVIPPRVDAATDTPQPDAAPDGEAPDGETADTATPEDVPMTPEDVPATPTDVPVTPTDVQSTDAAAG